MRDYAEHQAATFGAVTGTGILTRLWDNFRARRSLAKLHSFDDYMLRDIGLTRADVLWAEDLPLSVNATLALEERGRLQRTTSA